MILLESVFRLPMSKNSAYVFTSESVSEGHPDKVADQLSDSVLDAMLAIDKNSRVACEALVKNNTVILAGEIKSNAKINFDAIARQCIRNIGYTNPADGFDADTCEILKFISEQSPDISMGVDSSKQKNKEQATKDICLVLLVEKQMN